MNDSNDKIHPCALLPNGLSIIENCGVGNIPCRLKNSQYVLFLVSDKVSLVRIIVPNKNLLSQIYFQHHSHLPHPNHCSSELFVTNRAFHISLDLRYSTRVRPAGFSLFPSYRQFVTRPETLFQYLLLSSSFENSSDSLSLVRNTLLLLSVSSRLGEPSLLLYHHSS